MTRINLVPVEELADQHLVAEYREIFMIGSALQRSMASPNWEKNKKTIPTEFCLNTGHVKFFYNKGEYLNNRYLLLVAEMKKRGMKPNPDRRFKTEQWPTELYNDWSPTDRDLVIIRQRMQEKINMKPEWYKWTMKKNV